MYNFSQVGSDRKWLQDILLSDSESEDEISDENEYIRDMLRDHMKEQKFRTKYYQNANVRIFFCEFSMEYIPFSVYRMPNMVTMELGCCLTMTVSTSINVPLLASNGASISVTTRRLKRKNSLKNS